MKCLKASSIAPLRVLRRIASTSVRRKMGQTYHFIVITEYYQLYQTAKKHKNGQKFITYSTIMQSGDMRNFRRT